VVCKRDDDDSGRTTLPENQPTSNSPLTVVSALGEAASSLWTSQDTADQHGPQQLVHVAGEGRQSLASVGNESSFFRKDAVSDEHLCSTPSRSDDVDDQSPQPSSPPSDWMCTPAAVDFSPVSPPMTRDDRGQRSPPALSGRRYGCLQMPRLTPITEADNEHDDIGDDDDDRNVFVLSSDVAAAACAHRQTKDDSIRSVSLTDEPRTARSDIFDLTTVTPMTPLELTCPGSSNSDASGSGSKIRDLLPERDVADQAGAEIIGRHRLDSDDLTSSQSQNRHESSYSSVYSGYMYNIDDYTRAASTKSHQWNWDADDSDVGAQSAVLALSRRGRRLTYQKSFLNRTPIDVDMSQPPTDRVYRAGRYRQQQQHQLSVLSRPRDSLADDALTLEDDSTTPIDRSIRRRLSAYHESKLI